MGRYINALVNYTYIIDKNVMYDFIIILEVNSTNKNAYKWIICENNQYSSRRTNSIILLFYI